MLFKSPRFCFINLFSNGFGGTGMLSGIHQMEVAEPDHLKCMFLVPTLCSLFCAWKVYVLVINVRIAQTFDNNVGLKQQVSTL